MSKLRKIIKKCIILYLNLEIEKNETVDYLYFFYDNYYSNQIKHGYDSIMDIYKHCEKYNDIYVINYILNNLINSIFENYMKETIIYNDVKENNFLNIYFKIKNIIIKNSFDAYFYEYILIYRIFKAYYKDYQSLNFSLRCNDILNNHINNLKYFIKDFIFYINDFKSYKFSVITEKGNNLYLKNNEGLIKCYLIKNRDKIHKFIIISNMFKKYSEAVRTDYRSDGFNKTKYIKFEDFDDNDNPLIDSFEFKNYNNKKYIITYNKNKDVFEAKKIETEEEPKKPKPKKEPEEEPDELEIIDEEDFEEEPEDSEEVKEFDKKAEPIINEVNEMFKNIKLTNEPSKQIK